ncbi:MAG: 16S rRNA (guanine(527)-N(7))-methyltransferase RsmG [Oscillatoria sp. PMC 1051.18]|nr:16S rRNA (guanine(527)-N(7))-methyltransferase RsmG [Oscillatoria sp. PMC 1050.18]MEC5029744.1 16S rRNA (guanine(527)-N(7))-methyltransferase RsmG [Oscillatoria sp. PMC 1051.18]
MNKEQLSNLSRLPEMEKIWQKTLQWQPEPQQNHLFQQLYEEILSGNSQLNLTRITEPKEFWEKHLWDSLQGIAPLAFADKLHSNVSLEKANLIDIGTGAGFPGIPVAIAVPHCHVTLLDSTAKKITFLNSLLVKLNLPNVKTLTARAEAIGQQSQHREAYDFALIRAVGSVSVCAEYALPLLKIGGIAILYRGNWTDEEQKSLSEAVKQLGGTIESIEGFQTPLSKSIRHCVYLGKRKPSPQKFPRAIGIPTQQPL